MVYNLKLSGFKNVSCDSIDLAMFACFRKYPRAYFSDWQETLKQTWLDVYNNNILIGKIFEVM